jgi:hypothetical protein
VFVRGPRGKPPQVLDELAGAPGDEIVERRPRRAGEIERELFHYGKI